MHGLSGSGKTWLSARLMAALPAIRVRSDIERKRLFGLDERQASGSTVAGGIYTSESTDRVYATLDAHAGALLNNRHTVLLDAAFLEQCRRATAINTAREAGCSALILHAEATPDLLRRRIAARSAAGSDASEAGLAVLEHQLAAYEPLTDDESVPVITCDTGQDPDIERLATTLRDAAKRDEAA
jgi:predicted kinase